MEKYLTSLIGRTKLCGFSSPPVSSDRSGVSARKLCSQSDKNSGRETKNCCRGEGGVSAA